MIVILVLGNRDEPGLDVHGPLTLVDDELNLVIHTGRIQGISHHGEGMEGHRERRRIVSYAEEVIRSQVNPLGGIHLQWGISSMAHDKVRDVFSSRKDSRRRTGIVDFIVEFGQ
jgi:hypothetical protein